MGSLVNLPGHKRVCDGTAPYAVASDYRARLLMSNTTAGAENNETVISGYTLQDLFDGSGYADEALTSEAIVINAASNRLEFGCALVDFGALGDGTRMIRGVLIFDFVTNDSDSVPWVFIQFSADFNPGGDQVQLQWDEGFLQVA